MPVVREELGPSLPQLLAPRWGALGRRWRVALVAVVVGIFAALLVARAVLREHLDAVVVREPVAFNLVHRPELEQVTPQRGELLRLQSTPASKTAELFTVRALTVPRYQGDISSAYLLLASAKLRALRAADPQVQYRGEGKARINLAPGYQLNYQTRRGGRLFFGKIYFLAPEGEDGEPQTRDGAEVRLLSEFSPSTTPNLGSLGSAYLLRSPLRSFRFGTERP